MVKIYYIVYATHEEGLFNELVNNKYNVEIKVLGFGEKWNGYTDKYKAILNFINNNNLNDDDIIVSIDGFDSLINKDVTNIYNDFLKYDTKILLSRDFDAFGNKYFGYNKFIFGKCNNVTANAGLYMGFVKYLKVFLNNTLKYKCKNDQLIMNKLCHNSNFIKIDDKEIIFQNLTDKNNKSDAYIISYPFTLSFNRVYRSVFEKFQYFHKYILFLFCIYLLYLYKNNKVYDNYYKIIMITIILIIFYLKSDFTCINMKKY